MNNNNTIESLINSSFINNKANFAGGINLLSNNMIGSFANNILQNNEVLNSGATLYIVESNIIEKLINSSF